MKQAYLSEIFKEKKLNKRERFEIRVTLIEKRIIEKTASKAGLNPSEYIRRSALEKVIKTKFTEEELSILKMIFDIGIELKKIKSEEKNLLLNDDIDYIIKKLKNIISIFYDR